MANLYLEGFVVHKLFLVDISIRMCSLAMLCLFSACHSFSVACLSEEKRSLGLFSDMKGSKLMSTCSVSHLFVVLKLRGLEQDLVYF